MDSHVPQLRLSGVLLELVGIKNQRSEIENQGEPIMSSFKTFEELPIWQAARILVNHIYKLTHTRMEKEYALSNQMQRAAISIMANIAEGFERSSDKDFNRFLIMAKASCGELRSHLYIAYDLRYIDEKELSNLHKQCIELSRQIAGFSKYLQQ